MKQNHVKKTKNYCKKLIADNPILIHIHSNNYFSYF